MVLVTTLLMLGLLHCVTKYSSAFPLLHLMQLYNTIERVPQHSQHVNPGFVRTPNRIAQLVQPYQILSNYLMFGNHLMQPRTLQTQISTTYPIYGNLLPMSVGVPNTQMLPVVFTQVGQQGFLSGSDSEEGILSGVLMVPVDPGPQGNVFTIYQSGISISGPDSGILLRQPAVNPVGQQGINITIQANESVLEASESQGVKLHGDVPGASILKPTHLPPNGPKRTPSCADPAVPSEVAVTESPSPATENWIFCNSYVPDHPEYQGMIRGDGHLPVPAPEYFFIDKNNYNQKDVDFYQNPVENSQINQPDNTHTQFQ